MGLVQLTQPTRAMIEALKGLTPRPFNVFVHATSLGTQWSGQGAPLARSMLPSELLKTFAAEMAEASIWDRV